jgi:3'(2'), 5'-bisphosphate nucleotidase
MHELSSILDRVHELTLEAGRRIMSFYRGHAVHRLKADSSPLTDADLAAHEFLVESLNPLLSNVPVVSEESHRPAHTPADGRRFWLVDPLDGTKEFIKGTDEFTVNVALVEQGKPVLGVVHAPALGVSYLAFQSGGAWRQAAGMPAQRISTRRANVRELSIVGSKDHAGPMVSALLRNARGAVLRSMGSSLKFCLVAEGKADIYLRDVPTMEWDTAAAQCVVQGAGGKVCLLDGIPLCYGKPDLRNPPLVTVGDCHLDWQPLVFGS